MDFQRQYGRHDGEAEERYGRGYGDPEWQRRQERETRRYEPGQFGRLPARFGGTEGERPYAGETWDRSRGTQTGGSLYGQGRHPESSWRPGADALRDEELRGASFSSDRDNGSPADWREARSISRGDSRSNARWRDSRPAFDTGEGNFSSYGASPAYGRGSEEARSGDGRYGPRAAFGGPHAGKGPKGYVRSDERIKEQVSDRLEESGEIDASEISVAVREGEVTLEGSIADRWMKRMAEELVEDSPGVKQVHNRLRVEKSNGPEGGLSGSFGKGRESASDKANRSRSGL